MYWPGQDGQTLAESDYTGAINTEYVYFNGQRVARVDQPSGGVHYYFSDHLGSARVITDANKLFVHFAVGKLFDDLGEYRQAMRHYDIADRTRNRFTGQIDFVPSDVWMFNVSGGILHDDFSNTVLGLQDSTGRTISLGADYHLPNGLGAGATYNFERYAGLQQSHEGDSSDA